MNSNLIAGHSLIKFKKLITRVVKDYLTTLFINT